MNYFLKLTVPLALLCATLCLPNPAFAQVDISTGTVVLGNGYDSNGNLVKLYDATGKPFTYIDNSPAGEPGGYRNRIQDTTNSGYADMMTLTRNVEEADKTYVQDGYLGNSYFGVIDFGVTRDAKWTTVFANSDLTTYYPTGTVPARADEKNSKGEWLWGSAARQESVANFLKKFSSADGYIDNYINSTPDSGVRATSAEVYGNAEFNAAGGMFDQMRARGYDAGTNYREGGLQYIDSFGKGVLGQSGGLYLDEGGQYRMDANGMISYNGAGIAGGAGTYAFGAALAERYGTSKLPGSQTGIVYDDWNQTGLVATGLDLIAYTTSFNMAGGLDPFVYGDFSVMGNFLDVYINGNVIDQSLLNLAGNQWGMESVQGVSLGAGGILGEYSFLLDLTTIDSAFWNADGVNDISFMVRTVSVWELGLDANTTYAKEMGFNFFSGGIAYGNDPRSSSVPEPATLAVLGLGLVGLGIARRRMRKTA